MRGASEVGENEYDKFPLMKEKNEEEWENELRSMDG